jgi:hypothetical protein
MEFNDSSVRDFQASNLKEECFGGDQGGSSGGFSAFSGWGMGGSSAYGKSGYMLFYARREKKPLELLDFSTVKEKPAEKVEEEKKDEEAKNEPDQIDSKQEQEKSEPAVHEIAWRDMVTDTDAPS